MRDLDDTSQNGGPKGPLDLDDLKILVALLSLLALFIYEAHDIKNTEDVMNHNPYVLEPEVEQEDGIVG